MTTETLGVLRMRRDTLMRDLKALNTGEAGQCISAAETRFYSARIAEANSRLVEKAG
jgi:hypothetical protein